MFSSKVSNPQNCHFIPGPLWCSHFTWRSQGSTEFGPGRFTRYTKEWLMQSENSWIMKVSLRPSKTPEKTFFAHLLLEISCNVVNSAFIKPNRTTPGVVGKSTVHQPQAPARQAICNEIVQYRVLVKLLSFPGKFNENSWNFVSYSTMTKSNRTTQGLVTCYSADLVFS